MTSSRRSAPVRVSIAPAASGWSVRCEASADRDTKVFGRQEDAVRAAQELVRETGGEILVHQSDGRIRQSFTLGRLGMRRLAAIEGLTVTQEMIREVKDFDRRGLSARERQVELARRFSKAGR